MSYPHLTIGVIGKRLGLKINQVEYIVNKHNIPHVGRWGVRRVYDEAAVEKIKELLKLRAQRLEDQQSHKFDSVIV